MCIRHIDKARLCSVKEKNKSVRCIKSPPVDFLWLYPRGRLLFWAWNRESCVVQTTQWKQRPWRYRMHSKPVVLFWFMFDKEPEEIEISWWQKNENQRKETLCGALSWVPFVYKTKRLNCRKGFDFPLMRYGISWIGLIPKLQIPQQIYIKLDCV